ncbi:MAG: CDP-glucose 4,6-dehydratase, partial [Fibrobacter sp.]|nr:CDP-glucose 4,6-dehydratase [Fibrobacter sp.]
TNNEWEWGYRENDRLGGYDPYSSSKACAEIVVDSYRNSFFNTKEYGKSHHILVASARAGNVIGGGDWSEDRLLPDIIKSGVTNTTVVIRNPDSIRPWQHVLDCLSGYLVLGHKLLEGDPLASTAFNFGPADSDTLTVKMIVEKIKVHWPDFEYTIDTDSSKVHEANYLKLDCSKAQTQLKWLPVWNTDTAIDKTVNWYRDFYHNNTINTGRDLDSYIDEAVKAGVIWTR